MYSTHDDVEYKLNTVYSNARSSGETTGSSSYSIMENRNLNLLTTTVLIIVTHRACRTSTTSGASLTQPVDSEFILDVADELFVFIDPLVRRSQLPLEIINPCF